MTALVALLLALTMTPGVRYRDWRWKRIAKTRRALDGNRCTRCRVKGVLLNVHHKRAVSAGGSHALWNLTTLCQSCHELAHARDLNRDGRLG